MILHEDMNNNDKARLHEFYIKAFDEYGDDAPESVHWLNVENQNIRFDVLLGVANITGFKILDVGCGLGDLYRYFLNRKIELDYTGIDIMPEFIEKAQEKYPDAKLILGNITEYAEQLRAYNNLSPAPFDYVLASGALSFKVEHNKEFYFSFIKTMYDLAGKAVAFNMLNKNDHVDDAQFAAYDPEKIREYCQTFCDDVQIVVDYLPQDFTVYLYKS